MQQLRNLLTSIYDCGWGAAMDSANFGGEEDITVKIVLVV